MTAGSPCPLTFTRGGAVMLSRDCRCLSAVCYDSSSIYLCSFSLYFKTNKCNELFFKSSNVC